MVFNKEYYIIKNFILTKLTNIPILIEWAIYLGIITIYYIAY